MRNCCGFWWGRKQNTVNHDGNEIDTLLYVWKSGLRTMIFSMVRTMKSLKAIKCICGQSAFMTLCTGSIDFAVC